MKTPPMPLGGRIAIVIGLLLMVLVLALSGCASKPEGVQITVSEAKAASCQAQGGCGLLSLDQLRAMLKQAHDEGAAEVAEGLDSQGCRRGST